MTTTKPEPRPLSAEQGPLAADHVVDDVYARRPWIKHYDVPATVTYPSKKLQDFLVEHAAQTPNRPAIVFYDHVLSYRELEQASAGFATMLIGLGIQPGDRVALLLPNTPQFVIAYYGTLRAGAVVVPTNPLYVGPEIEHQLKDSGAKAILTLSKFYPTVEAIRRGTGLEHILVTNIKEYFPLRLRLLFTLAKERKDGHRVSLPADGRTYWLRDALRKASVRMSQLDRQRPSPYDDLALLQYTGGTTGVAMGAMLTHRNLVANLMMIQAWLGKVPPRRDGYHMIMGVLPLFHSYGMQTIMNTAIVGGGTMVLVPRFEHLQVLKAIQRYRPNLFPGVPAMYNALNTFPGVEKFDLRSVDACISGAAPLPVEVKRRFEELTGAHLVEGYGLTEASPVTHANPLHGMNKPGSIGIPFPDTDARIVDLESGNTVLPPGELGELLVRGPQVMQGYWRRDEQTAAVLRDGWLYTGDIASMDDDGYFFLVDRKKDMIISGGLNVYPRNVEEVLYTHPKVQQVVALGVPDARWGEAVKVFVVLKDGETATEQEIIDFCQTRMAAFKVPKAVEFRRELPMSLIGKVLRRTLREEEHARRKEAA